MTSVAGAVASGKVGTVLEEQRGRPTWVLIQSMLGSGRTSKEDTTKP